MKREILLVIVIIIICIPSYTLNCSYPSYHSPSAFDRVFGSVSGCCNIWNTNPLSVWSNPAKLGYHRGFSLGYSSANDSNYNEISYRAAYITYGYKGMGVMLPMINSHGKFGYSYKENDRIEIDEDGNLVKTADYYDSSSQFAFGFNLLEIYNNYNTNELTSDWQNFTDLSMGYNGGIAYESNTPNYGTSEIEGNEDAKYNYSDGLGMVLRISPLNETNFKEYYYLKADIITAMDLNGIISSYNKSFKSGFSLRLAADLEKYLPEYYDVLSDISKNVVTMYISYETCNSNEFQFSSSGIELTFLDILSLRTGKDDDAEKYNFGIGLNFQYKDYYQFQLNIALLDKGDFNNQVYLDIMLNVNLSHLFFH
ncbi:MAG: hypothetical protein K9M99_06685 [Candidatus Cloacimonetes bacterium]|nr:hypothetical protein [Candidatus Cloacimonadota bacterium]